MNKKQAVIIVTLLVLIVCVGMLATKVNGPLYSKASKSTTDDKSTVSINSTQEATTASSYFVEAKMVKEQQTSKTLQDLKSIIDDENVDQKQKEKVIEEFNKIATNADKETKVELALKGKGYEDVVCMIEGENKVRIIVKAEKDLDKKQYKEIQDVVMSITKLNDVEIEKKE